MSTEELVKRCIGRDYSAWAEFVRRYQGLVRKAVHYKLNKMNAKALKSEAIDIAQEVFLQLWQDSKLSKLRDITCLENWLVMVTLNRTSNYCKRRRKELFLTMSLNDRLSDGEYTLENIVPCRKLGPEKAVEIKEMMELLKGEMRKLREKERKVLEMFMIDGKKQTDIAATMDIPVSTVSTLIHRAKKQVREGMMEYCCS